MDLWMELYEPDWTGHDEMKDILQVNNTPFTFFFILNSNNRFFGKIFWAKLLANY